MSSLLRPANFRPYVVGHRGALGVAPGNSWKGFEMGLASGADFLECDIQISSDGHAIVFHGFSLPKEDKDAWIWELSLSEIRSLAGGDIILLEDLLAWARNRIGLFLDLKIGFQFNTPIVEAVVNVIHKTNMIAQVTIIAWTHSALLQAKKLEPRLSTAALLYSRPVDPVAVARSGNIDALLIRRPQLDAAYVEKLHAHHIAVGAIDIIRHECENYRQIADIGVDLMIVNYPLSAMQCLQSLTYT